MATTALNYTDEMIATLKAMYKPKMTTSELKVIAEAVNRPPKSVLAKLVNLKVYVAPDKPVKAAKKEGPTKKDLLNEISARCEVDTDEFFNGGKGASIAFLMAVRDALPTAEEIPEEVPTE